jgi:hypothetical protein
MPIMDGKVIISVKDFERLRSGCRCDSGELKKENERLNQDIKTLKEFWVFKIFK